MKKKKFGLVLPYTRNNQGVMVKRCCASCAYKQLTDARKGRHCAVLDVTVKPRNTCGLWQMSSGLEVAGIGMGMVKRKEYLQYLMVQRQEEQRRRESGERVRERKVEVIRREFESNNCSIYLNF